MCEKHGVCQLDSLPLGVDLAVAEEVGEDLEALAADHPAAAAAAGGGSLFSISDKDSMIKGLLIEVS